MLLILAAGVVLQKALFVRPKILSNHQGSSMISGNLWQPLVIFGDFGLLWRSSIFGDLQRSLVIFVNLRRSSSIFSNLCQSSAIFVNLWRSLAIFCDLWQSMVIFSDRQEPFTLPLMENKLP